MSSKRVLSPLCSPYPLSFTSTCEAPTRGVYTVIHMSPISPCLTLYLGCVSSDTLESYLPSASCASFQPLAPLGFMLRYCGPRDTCHVPFRPCVHQLLRIYVFDLDSLGYLSKHRIAFESSSHAHLEILHLSVVYVSAMSP